MSDFVILRRETYPRVAWPNGGGITDDIVVEPEPVPDRRLSLATIARDGPFSAFNGYDRTFVLALGAGVRLQPAHAAPVVLDELGTVYAFAGETPLTCALLAGEVRAFNVFTRRAVARAEVAVERIAAGTGWSPPGAGFVFVVAGELDSAAGPVREHDTLAVAAGAPELRARRAALVVRVRFAGPAG